ncbi:MAG: PAS domain S-box protein [Solidesulfovibrio sp.]
MKSSSCLPALGRRLRHLRLLAALTQAALADRSGVSLEHLNKIERGAASPSLSAIESLCQALEVEPAMLFLFPADTPDSEGSGIDWPAAHARQGFFVFSRETGTVVAAPSLLRLLGYAGKSRQELLEEFLLAVFPKARASVAEALIAVVVPGDRQALGLSFCRQDGEARHGSLVVEMFAAGEGKEATVLGVLTDVSEPFRLERVVRTEMALIDRRVQQRTARLERAVERLRRENADLIDRERRYRSVFENVPMGVSLSTTDGEYLEANPALARMYGYESPRVLCREVTDISRQVYAEPGRREELERILAKNGSVAGFEVSARRRDGTLVATRRDVRAVTDATGQVLHYESFVQDVPAKDSVAQYLRRYTRIIAASSDMVALIDGGGNYLFVNDAYIAAFGVPRDAIIGHNASEFLGKSYYEREVAPRLAECLGGREVHFEQWVVLPGRGRCFLSVHYAPWAEEIGGTRSVVASIRDLTETRLAVEELRESEKTTSILYRVSSAVASEEDMENLFRTIHNILGEALAAKEFFIALANRQTDQLEYVLFASETRPSPPPIPKLASRLPPLTTENFNDFKGTDVLFEVMRTAHPLRITRMGMRLTGMTCPDRTPEVWLGVPIRVRQEVLGVMAVMDFSDAGRFSRKDAELMLSVAEQLALGVERRRNLDALRAAKEDADRANRAKGQFLAGMSHEIRTPMNAILGLTEVALRTELTDEQRDYLDTVSESAKHLLGVLNDILDFSKIEARQMTLDVVDFDLHELLRSVVKTLDVGARAKGLFLSLDVTSGVPRNLRGDPVKVRQILVNLVGNAIKFTASGGISLRVSHASPVPGTLPHLVFEIADTGIGIRPEMLDVIFESFRQADNTTARQYGGTGLGLSISRELANLMGGDIKAESTPGKGSRFVFTAPFAPGRAGPARDARRLRKAVPVRRTLRILLAEDNPVNIKLMTIHLQKLQHIAVTALSGEDALALLAAEPFDLVLMDIEMPSMDGLTAARIIRAGGREGQAVRDRSIPIIAVTAHVSTEVRQACAEAGMDDYVGKPVNLDELAGTINRLAPPSGEDEAAATVCGSRPESLEEGPQGVLDVDWALRRLGIDRDFFTPILALSLDEFQKRLDAAKSALDVDDMSGLGLNAHTLKSTAATIGAAQCQELAAELERLAASRSSDAARALLPRLDLAYAAVRAARACLGA